MPPETRPGHLPEPPVTTRFDGVDLLRGLSIIAVVLLHGNIRLLFSYDISIQPLLPKWLMHVLFSQGGNGVTVFFAISGFLITTTSLRRFGGLGAMRAAVFYRIRFARITPLFLGLLGVLSALHLAHVDGFLIKTSCGTLPQALFAALTFRINRFEAVHGYLPANWDVMWSLSIEEMFYLFFPLACVVLLRWRRGMLAFLMLLVTLVGLGPFARTVWGFNEIWQGTSYLAGMSDIALGCLAALAADWFQQARPRWATTRVLLGIEVAGAALMVLIVIWPPWRWVKFLGRSGTDDTVLSLATCMVILGSVLRARPGRVWLAPVRWFGRHSYEVYLTHEFGVVWLSALYVRVHRGSPLAWIAAELGVAAVVGAAVARWYSEPMNRWLRGATPPQRPLPL